MTYRPFIHPSIQPSSITADKSIVTPLAGVAVGAQGKNHLCFEESSAGNSQGLHFSSQSHRRILPVFIKRTWWGF